MDMMQLEERLTAIEKTLEQLKGQLVPVTGLGPASTETGANQAEEELIPGAEYPLVLAVPRRKATRLRARIRSIRRGRQDLGLSDKEWASLGLEDDDE
jgi:hypothetical protein